MLEPLTLPKQPRSQKTLDAIFRAAHQLLAHRDYDTVSIADIAQAARCSVGTIYTRFPSKDALFQVLLVRLVEQTSSQVGAALAELPHKPRPREIIHTVVRCLAEIIGRDAGIVRSALRRSQMDPEVWTPLRQTASDLTERAIALLAKAQGGASKAQRTRMAFGFQMVNGTLLNMVINNPGPMTFDNPDLVDELTDAVHAYLTTKP